MKRGLLLLLYLCILLMPCWTVRGEDVVKQTVTMSVAEISVLNVSGNPSRLTVLPPQTGGQKPQDATAGNTYIQYSSTVGVNQHRTLTARWGLFDTAPAGCALKLRADPSGKQNEGTSAGEIVLSPDTKTILTDIRSCATGTNSEDGARLFYILSVTDTSLLTPGDTTTATITLTLTDVS